MKSFLFSAFQGDLSLEHHSANHLHCWVSYKVSLFLSLIDNHIIIDYQTKRKYIQMCFKWVLWVSNEDLCQTKTRQRKHQSLVFNFGGAFDFQNIFKVVFFFAIFVPAAASSVKLAKTTVYRRSNKLKIALWKYRRNGLKYSLVISVTVAFPCNSFVANSLQLWF